MTNKVEIVKNSDYEILAPSGWEDFDGMRKLDKENWVRIHLEDDTFVECTDYHPFVVDGQTISARDLKVGEYLNSTNKNIVITKVELFSKMMPSYDVLEVGEDHLLFVNDIVVHNCDFLQSGNTVIDTEDILWQEQTNVKDPKETINIPDPDNAFGMLTKGKEVWIWENPVPGESYVISCDVARGDGADFSALSIWKLPTEEEIEKNLGPQQVCSFKGKIKTNDYGKLIDTLGRTYNNAIAVVENVGLGIATLNELVEREYPNLYYTDKAAKQVSFDEGLNIGAASKVPGFTTSAKSRPLVADATEAAWRSRQYIIRDKRYLTEAKTWIWKNGRAEHEEGCHDDLMMANGFFLYLYLTSIRQQGLAHDRYIGAINLVSKKREEKLNKMADLIKVSQIKRSSEWSLEYASGQNGEAAEAWNLTELIRR